MKSKHAQALDENNQLVLNLYKRASQSHLTKVAALLKPPVSYTKPKAKVTSNSDKQPKSNKVVDLAADQTQLKLEKAINSQQQLLTSQNQFTHEELARHMQYMKTHLEMAQQTQTIKPAAIQKVTVLQYQAPPAPVPQASQVSKKFDAAAAHSVLNDFTKKRKEFCAQLESINFALQPQIVQTEVPVDKSLREELVDYVDVQSKIKQVLSQLQRSSPQSKETRKSSKLPLPKSAVKTPSSNQQSKQSKNLQKPPQIKVFKPTKYNVQSQSRSQTTQTLAQKQDNFTQVSFKSVSPEAVLEVSQASAQEQQLPTQTQGQSTQLDRDEMRKWMKQEIKHRLKTMTAPAAVSRIDRSTSISGLPQTQYTPVEDSQANAGDAKRGSANSEVRKKELETICRSIIENDVVGAVLEQQTYDLVHQTVQLAQKPQSHQAQVQTSPQASFTSSQSQQKSGSHTTTLSTVLSEGEVMTDLYSEGQVIQHIEASRIQQLIDLSVHQDMGDTAMETNNQVQQESSYSEPGEVTQPSFARVDEEQANQSSNSNKRKNKFKIESPVTSPIQASKDANYQFDTTVEVQSSDVESARKVLHELSELSIAHLTDDQLINYDFEDNNE